MHAAGDRAKGRLAIDIRAEAPGDGTTFISRVGIRSTETTPGWRECSESRGQGYGLRFLEGLRHRQTRGLRLRGGVSIRRSGKQGNESFGPTGLFGSSGSCL
jgi:hypothetical protein